MDLIRLVEFDIRGTNPVNKFVGEKIPIEDKTCPYLIPNASPFFGNPLTTKLYDERGGELRLGIDYEFSGEFTPFCELSGKEVVTFIKLKDSILVDSKFVTLDYQSIGANFVPRNSLQDWLKTLNTGKTPIPFHKVMKIPATLPPKHHWHNVKTEITDWYELTYFYTVLAGILGSIDLEVGEQINAAVEFTFGELTRLKLETKATITDHDSNVYNPHGITKEDLDLGNVDNFKTATLAEDEEGIREDLFSTPKGIQEAVKNLSPPDVSSLIKTGVVPVSLWGTAGYIPPNISGSFEAVAYGESKRAFCMEANGELVMLSARTDGRVKGLYFSVGSYKGLVYTSYKYSHPYFVSRGIEPDIIVNGSGEGVLVVGDSVSNRLFVTLTNNTLNPDDHDWSEVDSTQLERQLRSNGGRLNLIHYLDNLNTFLGGDWVYLTLSSIYQSVNVQSGILGGSDGGFHAGGHFTSILRVPKSQVGVNSSVVPVVQRLYFQDLHGVTVNNADRWRWAWPVRNGSNQITRYVFNHTTYWLNPSGPYYHHPIITTPHPTKKNVIYIKFISFLYGVFDDATGWETDIDASYEFNLENGVMTLLDKTSGTINKAAGTLNNINFRVVGRKQTFTFVNREKILRTNSTNLTGFKIFDPPSEAITKSFQKLKNDWGYLEVINDSVQSPVSNFLSNDFFHYHPEGMFFSSNNSPNYYFKKVSGRLGYREGVTNLKVPNILAQKLTNNIKSTNLNFKKTDGVNVSCSNADLDRFGVDLGDSSFCSSLQNYWYGKETQDIELITDYVLEDVSPNEVNVVPTKRIHYPASVVERIKREVQYPNKLGVANAVSVRICDPTGGRLTNRFGWLPVTVFICLTVKGEYTSYQTLMTIYPTYSNGVVTGYSVATKLHNVHVGHSMSNIKQQYSGYSAGGKTLMFISGNSLRVEIHGISTHATGNTGWPRGVLVYNNKGNKVLNSHQIFFDWAVVDTSTMFRETTPYGIGYLRPTLYDGGANTIYQVGGQNILLHSVYPEKGWIIYLQDQTSLLLDGTFYRVPGGSVDLRDVEKDPSNKKFYIYITMREQVPTYLISMTKLRRSAKALLVANVVTGPTQILTIERLQPFVIDGKEITTARLGGSLPVSTGLSQDDGALILLKNSELLP